MGKVDDALEYAEVAQQLAGSAVVNVQTQGLIFEGLIHVLLDSKFISRDAVAQMFRGVAAIIDDAKPATEVARQNFAGMREHVERIAANFDVTLPAAGQTDFPRKH